MLRPTRSPVVFLQQLGRGLRRNHGKDALTVIDFIGNHRSFLIKPRTLLALGTGRQVGTDKVLRAMRTTSSACQRALSPPMTLSSSDILRTVMRVGARSALEDYCRSYADERGYRPSALQAYEAGYSPSSARARHGHWFAFLDDVDLLGQQESKVCGVADVLDGIEKEQVTKSYKLVTLQALLQMDALRTGADVAEIALDRPPAGHRRPTPAGRHQLGGDARPGISRRRHLASILAELAATGLGGPIARRISQLVPRRRPPVRPNVPDRHRCGRNLRRHGGGAGRLPARQIPLHEEQPTGRGHPAQGHPGLGRPILMLDRDHNPQLPEGETLFIADGVSYSGNFAKIALNVAHRAGHLGNVLADLLWSWFGTSAGQPGTVQYVELVPGKPHGKCGRDPPPPPVTSLPTDSAGRPLRTCRNRAGWSTMASRRYGESFTFPELL